MNRRTFLASTGAALLIVPLAARAQQPAMPVVGILGTASGEANRMELAAFHQGLHENGYVEGRNVAIEPRWAEGRS